MSSIDAPMAKPIDYMALTSEQKLSVGLMDEDFSSAPKSLGMSRNEVKDIEEAAVPALAKIVSCCLCPVAPCAACFTVGPREEAAILHFGVLTKMEKNPGCHMTYPFGRSILKTSTKQKTLSLPESKIADATGSPVIVSAVLNYRVVDSKKALLNVDNVNIFVNTNAQSVLKQCISRYTYEQLKNEASVVTRSLLNRLQPLVSVAGVHVQSMQLNELNYAPEIASGMLKKQQASALIEARKLIVEGAVAIAQDAVTLLERGGAEGGIRMNDEQKCTLITNLLTVTCAEGDVQPTVPLRR